MDEFVLFVRTLLVIVFFSSAVSKLKKMGEHIGIVQDYKVLPKPLVIPFAKADPIVELFIGIIMMIGFTQWSGIVAALLLLSYSVAIVINLVRGRTEMSCGCGGVVGDHTLSWWLVLRNSAMIMISLWVACYQEPLANFHDVLFMGVGFWESFDFRAWGMMLAAVVTVIVMTSVQMMLQIRREYQTLRN